MPLTEPEKNGSYTYADYKTRPDNERWELINGIAYNMGPAPTRDELISFFAVQGVEIDLKKVFKD